MVWQDFSVELLRLSRTIGLCVAPATNRQVDGVFLGTADSTEEHVATTSARYAPVSLRNTSSREVNILRCALNMWSDPHLRMLTPRLGCPHRNKRRSVPGQLVNSYPIYPQAAVHKSVNGGLQSTISNNCGLSQSLRGMRYPWRPLQLLLNTTDTAAHWSPSRTFSVASCSPS